MFPPKVILFMTIGIQLFNAVLFALNISFYFIDQSAIEDAIASGTIGAFANKGAIELLLLIYTGLTGIYFLSQVMYFVIVMDEMAAHKQNITIGRSRYTNCGFFALSAITCALCIFGIFTCVKKLYNVWLTVVYACSLLGPLVRIFTL